MVLETIRNHMGDIAPTSNKFTRAEGKLTRLAREEACLNQAEFTQRIYRRRATVSGMENGKVELSSTTLPLLAGALEKPLTYFCPPALFRELKSEKFSSQELELLQHASNIWSEQLRQVAIDQVRILAEFDPIELVVNNLSSIIASLENAEEIEQYLNNSALHKRRFRKNN